MTNNQLLLLVFVLVILTIIGFIAVASRSRRVQLSGLIDEAEESRKYPRLGTYGPNSEDLPDISRGFHIFANGNVWCAVGPVFVDLQMSHAGFGYTPQEAYDDWWRCNGHDFYWAQYPKPTLEQFTIHHPTVAPDGR